MTKQYKQIGHFGIFALEDILRAVPRESISLDIKFANVPKTPLEDFKVSLVQTSLIQIELIVKSLTASEIEIGSSTETFIDTTNERKASKDITLDEENFLKFFGFDEETFPNKTNQTEKITPERATAINFRIWMKKHKAYLRKMAEFEEATSTLVSPENPEYHNQYGRALQKKPSDAEALEFPTLAAKMMEKLQTKLAALAQDVDFSDSLTPYWSVKEDNISAAKVELLTEYMDNTFNAGTSV